MNKPMPVPGRERVAKRRAALRAQGLRLKQIWVLDVHSAEFKAEARRQSQLLNEAMKDSDDLAFVEAIQYWPPEDSEA